MANTIFPTDTATATPVAADLVMIADVSDSNKPKDNTIENIVLAVVDDASTLTTRIWSASKTNTELATKQASDATLTTLSGKSVTGTWNIVLATSPTLVTPVLWDASATSVTIGWASGNTLVVDTNTLITDATNHRNGILTTAPTHSLTFGSTSTGIALHNQADQTTNYERLLISRASNVATFGCASAWSASGRIARMETTSSTGWSLARWDVNRNAGPFFSCNITTNASTTGERFKVWSNSTQSTASSGAVTFFSVTPTVNQTSTAAYTWLLVNVTEIGTWSGDKNLQLWQVGGTTKAGMDNNWWLLNARVIAPSWTTTPVTVTAPESNKIYTNEWATSKIVYNLPTAVAGYTYTFIVQDADWIDVTAAAWDTIRRNTSVTAAAWTVTSTAIGSILTLVAINATERIATSEVWTWS